MSSKKIPVSFSCPRDIDEYLDELSNRSKYIVKALRNYREETMTDEELAFKVKSDIEKYQRKIEELKKQKENKKQTFEESVGTHLEDFIEEIDYNSIREKRIKEFVDYVENNWDKVVRDPQFEFDCKDQATTAWDGHLEKNYGLSGNKAIDFVKEAYEHYKKRKEETE